MRGRGVVSLVFGIASLMIGIALYLLFRPVTLKAFEWVDYSGGMNSLMVARSHIRSWIAISGWVEYSVPAALWAISWAIFMGEIWRGHSRTTMTVWMLIVPAIGILSEILQAAALLPGRYDIRDVMAYCAAIPLAFTLSVLLGGMKDES